MHTLRPLQHELERLRESVRRSGGRLTAATESVFRYLLDEQRPVSIEEIQAGCRPTGRKPHLVSLYRITGRLQELEFVKRVMLGDGMVRYEPAAQGHHHHIVCSLCGTISELDVCGMEEIEKYVRDVLMFRDISHSLEYKGICPDCHTGMRTGAKDPAAD
jgi:Fur family ferric uptake transcriptional regulator